MQKSTLVLIIIFTFSISSFGQINDPAPNFDSEPFRTAQNLWEFSKKPYKKITTINDNRKTTVQEFDSIGRNVLTIVYFLDLTRTVATKYKKDLMVGITTKQIYDVDEKGIKKGPDEIIIREANFDKKGDLIDGAITRLVPNGTYKVVNHSFYDKKNRLIKMTDTLGISSTNNYYSKNNLIKQEIVYQKDPKNKTTTERIYKYDKNNQLYFSESSSNKYVDNKLVDKKIYYTVHQTFENKLLVKKVLIDQNVTNERIYKYDGNKNLIYFLETKKNTGDDLVIYQMKTTHKYENNHLVYTENYDGSSSHASGQFSFSYYFYSENDTLAKTVNTYDVERDKQAEVRYSYNEYNHIIKTETLYPDTGSRHETVYEIEYY